MAIFTDAGQQILKEKSSFPSRVVMLGDQGKRSVIVASWSGSRFSVANIVSEYVRVRIRLPLAIPIDGA